MVCFTGLTFTDLARRLETPRGPPVSPPRTVWEGWTGPHTYFIRFNRLYSWCSALTSLHKTTPRTGLWKPVHKVATKISWDPTPAGSSPLLRVEDGKHVLVGHEALLHISDFEVVQWQHVLLLFLLRREGRSLTWADRAEPSIT